MYWPKLFCSLSDVFMHVENMEDVELVQVQLNLQLHLPIFGTP
jgi:hypothetical protein